MMAQAFGFQAMYVAASLMGLVGVAVLLAGTARRRARVAPDDL